MKKFILCVLFLSVFAPLCVKAADQPDEWELWRKGYETYENAESTQLEGKKAEALDKYKNALDYFSQVKKLRPDWNKKTIDYRIELCNKKIESLSEVVNKHPAPNTKTTSKASDLFKPFMSQKTDAAANNQNAANAEASAELKKELEKYKAKYSETAAQIASLSKELEKKNKAAEELSSVMKEKMDQSKKYLELQAQFDAMKNKSFPPEDYEQLKAKLVDEKTKQLTVSKDLDVIRTENEALKKQQQELLQTRTQLNFELKAASDKQNELKYQLENITQKEAESSKKLSESVLKSQKLEKQLSDLSANYDKKVQESARYLDELKAMQTKGDNATAVKQIQSENELLRKNLSELQSKADKLSADNAAISSELKQKTSEFIKLGDTSTLLKKDKTAVDADLALVRTRLAQNDQTVLEQKQKITELDNKNSKLSAELKLFADKYEALYAKSSAVSAQGAKPSEAAAPEAKNKGATEELERKLKELATAKELLEQKLKQLSAEKNAIEKDLAQSNDEKIKLQRSLKQASDTLAGIDAEKTAKQQNSASAASAAPLSDTAAKTLSPIDAIKDRLNSVNEKISEYTKHFGVQSRDEYTVMTSSASKDVGADINSDTVPSEQKLEQNVSQSQPVNKNEDKTVSKPAAKKDATAPFADKHKRKLNDDSISLLLKNAASAMNDKDYKTAIWHYEKVLASQPENYEATKRLGMIYAINKDEEKALQYLEKAGKINEDDADVITSLVPIYVNRNQFSLATNILNRAVITSPKNPLVYKQLAMVCEKIGKNDFADTEYKKAVELDPDSAETALLYAQFLSKNPAKKTETKVMYQRALKLGAEPDSELEKAVSKNPGLYTQNPLKKPLIDEMSKPVKNIDTKDLDKTSIDRETINVLLKDAEKAEAAGDIKTALWNMTKVASIDRRNIDVLKKTAALYLQNHNEGKGLEFYEAAAKLKDDDAEIIKPLSGLYIKYGRYKEALELLNIGVTLAPKDPAMLRNMAVLCRNTGKKEMAEKNFRKSFELDPKSSETAIEMARFLAFTCGNYKEGAEWYAKAKELGAKPDSLLEKYIKK